MKYCIKNIDFPLLAAAAVPGSILIAAWLEIFVQNKDSFTLSLSGALAAAAGIFLLITFAAAVFLFAAGYFRWKKWLWAAFFGIACSAVIQYRWGADYFKSELPDGNEIWAALVVIGFHLFFLAAPAAAALWQRERCFKWRLKIAAVLLLTQLVSLVFACFTSRGSNEGYDFREHSFTEKEKFTFGTQKNIIVLVVDCMGERIMKDILSRAPDLQKCLKDFTCFDRMVSPLPRTMYAVPALLTGINFPEAEKGVPADDDHAAYLNRVCREDTSLLKLAKTAGFRTEGYPFILQTICYAPDVIDNSQTITEAVKKESAKKISEIVLSRLIPDFIKGLFTEEFSSEPLPFVTQHAENAEGGCYDQLFYRRLKRDFRLGPHKNVFKYLHIHGAHDPVTVNEKLETQKNVLRTQQLRGSLKIVELLLQKLKEHNIYDSSTIVITGDHTEKYTPEIVTFVKRPFEKRKALLFNAAPCQVSQIAGTVARAGGLSPKAPTLFELPFLPGSLTDVRDTGRQFPEFTSWQKDPSPLPSVILESEIQGTVLLHQGRIMVDLAAEPTLRQAEKVWVTAVNAETLEQYTCHLIKGKPFRDLLLPSTSFKEGIYHIRISEEGRNSARKTLEQIHRIMPVWFRIKGEEISICSERPDLSHLPVHLNREMLFHLMAAFPGVVLSPGSSLNWNGLRIPESEFFRLKLPPSRKNCKVHIAFKPFWFNDGRVSVRVNGKVRGSISRSGTLLNEYRYTVFISPEESRMPEFTFEFIPEKKRSNLRSNKPEIRISSIIVTGQS